MVNLMLIGPPGAGKGTQAERLVRDLGVLHLSTGDLLRNAIQNDTTLGRKAKQAVEAGELVPDDVVIGLVETRLEQKHVDQGFILDGFPRTQEQAAALEVLLERLGQPLDHVIIFEIPADVLLSRVEHRAMQSKSAGHGARADDNADVLRKRLHEYGATTRMIPFYEKRGLVTRVDANTAVDEVSTRIRAIIGTSPSPIS